MKKHTFILKGKCYVLLESRSIKRNRKKYDAITQQRFDMIWYPERGMSLIDEVCYRPYVDTVVTESPWIISCYYREDVFIWDSEIKDWVNPCPETYGASVDHIYTSILGIDCLLPRIPLNGVNGIVELRNELGC